MTSSSLFAALAEPARRAPKSGIVEVFNYGRGREGLIPLWVGEGDLPTPGFIAEAASAALGGGETFYTWQAGVPELRAALARYHARLYGVSEDHTRFYVTVGGMQAIQISIRLVAGAGDEVIVPTPAWPNFAAAAGVGGAKPVQVPMSFGNDGWTPDIERLEAAVTPRTRAILVNSPSNPTGWVASLDDLKNLLALARRHGLWIVADEVYGRFVYAGGRAPSFHDVADPEDRILYTNTFSKNWAMTGWRMGWIEADPSLGPTIESLIQYSTSGVPPFLQRGAVAAVEQGDPFIARQIERAAESRAALVEALSATGRVRYAEPAGAFYLFVAIDGLPDTRALALRLVDEALVGVAPGTAFGAGGEGFLRLCYLREPAQVAEAGTRLAAWIKRAETPRI
ncbi:aspartate/methionine/tyrosine aminotransferase [Methylopila capsulata]|uniref:aspartate transaminase n=1 Tax=Methylopila capsulata TaxID=61654 RepID=A0A9W6IXS1_9HYPH|nr:pyridoxal phosphate-dependent aminotransferase [Methylopila capsulata]MBM7852895.1 aspartate/methionine/tyrosine aminotransferase [Methylopila capsulata]GLK57105.1 aminotransferase [Methylopila capsulata]